MSKSWPVSAFMRVIPAIDILDGRCVRLQGGGLRQGDRLSGFAVEMAAVFFDMGVVDLHVVDLDAAKAGRAGEWGDC